MIQILKVFKRSSEYPRSIIKLAVHNVLWTYPLTLLPSPRELHGHREGERCGGISISIAINERCVRTAWPLQDIFSPCDIMT